MQVIKEPNKVIANIWGRPKRKSRPYRPLLYVLSQRIVGKGTLHLNLVTGEIILLEERAVQDLDSLCNMINDVSDQLIEKHFLVPTDFEDQKSVDQLRKILNRLSNQKKSITAYTIMPTSHCNARCFYCFEADYPYIHMAEETADLLVKYMVEHCDEKNALEINWFGGEPTVGEGRIDQICKGLIDHNIDFQSFMYSNGYLFTDKMIEKAKSLWNLEKIQITLDGTEAVYNKTKAYKAAIGSPYRTVLDNVEKLLKSDIFVIIRLNMDYYNYEDLKKLIEELSDKYSNYTNIQVYVSVLFDNEGFDKIQHSDKDREILEKKRIDLEKLIIKKGLASFQNQQPDIFLKYNSCCVDSSTSLLVNPQGELTKCDHYPYDYIIGDIKGGKINQGVLKELREGFVQELCKDCAVYPVCYQLKVCSTAGKCYAALKQKKRQNIETWLNSMDF